MDGIGSRFFPRGSRRDLIWNPWVQPLHAKIVPSHTLLDFWPTETWANKWVLFYIFKFVVICQSAKENSSIHIPNHQKKTQVFTSQIINSCWFCLVFIKFVYVFLSHQSPFQSKSPSSLTYTPNWPADISSDLSIIYTETRIFFERHHSIIIIPFLFQILQWLLISLEIPFFLNCTLE